MNAKRDVSPTKRSSLSFHESQKLLWERAGSPIKSRSPKKEDSPGRAKNVEGIAIDDIDEPVKYDNGLTWYEKYAPQSIGEVLIHKRKLNDVEEVFKRMMSNETSRPRILLLTGPSGCSKSTLVKQLARKWVPYYRSTRANSSTNHITLSGHHSETSDYIIEYDNSSALTELGSLDSFRDFLNRAKYLNHGSNLSVILVEDLPNVFHQDTRSNFQKVIEEWLYAENVELPPLVLCLTECEISDGNDSQFSHNNNFSINNSFTAETILGRDILDHVRLKRIKFNPINMTLMKKFLLKIANNEEKSLKSNGKWEQKGQYIAKIAENGDIRSCLSALQFWATSNNDTMELYTKNNSINFFHALGKVLFGSQESIENTEVMSQLLENSRGIINTDNFKLGVLENYSIFMKGNIDISSAATIVDRLSFSDFFINLPESVEYFTRSVREILSQLQIRNDESKKESQHGAAFFPREWKCRRLMNTFRIQSEDLINVSLFKYDQPVGKNDIIMNLGFYSPLIRQKQNYKKRSLETYLGNLNDQERIALINKYHDFFQINPEIDVLERIGGPWSNISGDTNIKSSDDMTMEINSDVNKWETLKRRKLKTLIGIHEKMYEDNKSDNQGEMYESDDDDDMLMLDPLVDSEDEQNGNEAQEQEIDDLLEDDEDESIFELLSQQKPKLCKNLRAVQPDNSALLSDSDLEDL